jgi:hypothetical protein
MTWQEPPVVGGSQSKSTAKTTTNSVADADDNGDTPSYRAGHIKRERATRAEMQDRFDAIYEIVRDSQPTGIRFVYYTATTKGIVAKTDPGYNKVQRAILTMRRDSRIPWSWIVDTNRWMRKPTTWNSIDQFLSAAGESYRRALWHDSPVAVEVWCESESVAGVLHPITEKWDVPLYPIKGQTSDSFAWGAAQQYRDDERDLVIYYFGDHDPAGYEIESNLHAKLILHSGRDDIEWERVACTAEDVELLNLEGTAPKKGSYVDAMTGQRVPWHGKAVEIEAIDPRLLRRWLDANIEWFVDPEKLRITQAVEQSEREIFTNMARGYRAGGEDS